MPVTVLFAGRGVRWFVSHPWVALPVVLAVAGGLWARDASTAGWLLLAGWFLAATGWAALTAARGGARGVRATIIGVSRITRVRSRWPAVAQAVGYSSRVDGMRPWPRLRRVRLTGHGVTVDARTGDVARHGSDLDAVKDDIAAGMGCDRVRVRVANPEHTTLVFEWGAHLAREYRLHDLPAPQAPAGWPPRIVFGVTEDGGPASIIGNQSVLIGGVTTSGKSSAVWAILAGYVRQGVPIRVTVIDPGALEFGALKRALDAHRQDPRRPSICHEYARDPKQVPATFGHALRRMQARQQAMVARGDDVREHVATPEEPLDILVIDELLPYAKEMGGANINHPVGQLVYLGRKFGSVVIACSQLAKVEVIGDVRDLFPQRLCYRTKTRYMTDAALGEGAEADGAKCSKIDIVDQGVGYLELPGQRGYTEHRSAYVPNEETRAIAEGRLPDPPDLQKLVTARRKRRECGLYRHYGHASDGTPVLLYVGISNRPDIRESQHEADKPWWRYVDLRLSTLETLPDRKTAERTELDAIARERPVFNEVGNERNPWRYDWRKAPAGTDWQAVIDHAARRMADARWRT